MNLGGWERLLDAAALKVAEENAARAADLANNGVKVYPPIENIFAALEKTPPERCKVVLQAQDPYHGPNQANGLAFSVNEGCKFPPSLRNIFEELRDDVGETMLSTGELFGWAEQGVLLLNTVLTVEDGKANSHANWGWQTFTKAVLEATRELPQPIVFLLWGNPAQKAADAARVGDTESPRLIIRSPHPSPLSAYRGFFGSKPFGKANDWLIANGSEPIRW